MRIYRARLWWLTDLEIQLANSIAELDAAKQADPQDPDYISFLETQVIPFLQFQRQNNTDAFYDEMAFPPDLLNEEFTWSYIDENGARKWMSF